MSVSTSLATGVLNHIYRPTVLFTELTRPEGIWAGLHSEDPAQVAKPLETEFFGGSYARAQVFFEAPAATSVDDTTIVVRSSNELLYRKVPANILLYVGYWDASSAGTLLAAAPVVSLDATPTDGIVLNAGDNLTFLAGSLIIRVK